MHRFRENIKKYYKYALYSARAELKSDVANSYLSWLWWILEPTAFMLIYLFISQIVFSSGEPNFSIFIFIGLTVWNFFNKMITASVKLIKSNSEIVSKIYVPKYVLILQKSFVNLFKMFISWILVAVIMYFLNMPFTFELIYMIPIILTLYTITFGFCCIVLHFGVFIEDLSNVLNITLKLLFYVSGIFFAIMTKVPAPYNAILLYFNPIAYIMNDFRLVIISHQAPNLGLLFMWFIWGYLITFLGVRLIHKYENSYAKVV